MKKIFYISLTLLFFSFLLSGCNNKVQQNEDLLLSDKSDKSDKIVLKDKNKDLSFNIDLSLLDYELPYYTMACFPEIKYSCSEDGCEEVKPTVFILYDRDFKILYRCDEKPCDSYLIDEYQSGMFIYLRPKDAKELSIKIANHSVVDTIAPEMKNKYIELAGSGLSVLVSNGQCINK